MGGRGGGSEREGNGTQPPRSPRGWVPGSLAPCAPSIDPPPPLTPSPLLRPFESQATRVKQRMDFLMKQADIFKVCVRGGGERGRRWGVRG